MAVRYCLNCEQGVEAKRSIGIGTFILVILTGGLWLFLIPFYSKRCPMCKGTNFGKKPVNNVGEEKPLPISSFGNNQTKDDPLEKIKKLQELKDAGAITEEEFNEKKKILLGSI
jgi:hypothetical protein